MVVCIKCGNTVKGEKRDHRCDDAVSDKKVNGWHTRQRRIKWLRDHPEILAMSRVQVFNQMRSVGLIAPTTSTCDVNIKNLAIDAGYAEDESERFTRRYEREMTV
jgi:hypothetical protein